MSERTLHRHLLFHLRNVSNVDTCLGTRRDGHVTWREVSRNLSIGVVVDTDAGTCTFYVCRTKTFVEGEEIRWIG